MIRLEMIAEKFMTAYDYIATISPNPKTNETRSLYSLISSNISCRALLKKQKQLKGANMVY